MKWNHGLVQVIYGIIVYDKHLDLVMSKAIKIQIYKTTDSQL